MVLYIYPEYHKVNIDVPSEKGSEGVLNIREVVVEIDSGKLDFNRAIYIFIFVYRNRVLIDNKIS